MLQIHNAVSITTYNVKPIVLLNEMLYGVTEHLGVWLLVVYRDMWQSTGIEHAEISIQYRKVFYRRVVD